MRVHWQATIAILGLLCLAASAGSLCARSQAATQSTFQPPINQSNSPSSHTGAAKPAPPQEPPHRETYQRKNLVDVSNAQRVNVAQLEEALRESRGHSDRQVADQLERLGLTQRFTLQNLHRWQAELPGDRSRRALGLLADASAFLPLPPSEKLILPLPSPQEELKMIDRTILFVGNTLDRQPEVIARQSMERYIEVDPEYVSRKSEPIWRHFKTHHSKVYLRDGGVMNVSRKKESERKKNHLSDNGNGSYGGMLDTVLRDLKNGSLMWSHWEQGPRGPIAVLSYRIPREHSHYEVTFTEPDENARQEVPYNATAYHGEISLDPSTGTPVRLTMEADLNPEGQFRRSDLLIDYDQVQVGSQDFVVPVHLVDIVRRWIPGYDENGDYIEYGDEATMLTSITFSEFGLH